MSGLDLNALRTLKAAQAAQHLRHALIISSDEDLTLKLIQAVEQGSIPPSSFGIFLGVSRSPVSVKHALQQNASIATRSLGIKFLHKFLISSEWKQMWDCLGGTPGLVDLFSSFSVQHVKHMCIVIGKCAKPPRDSNEEAKRQLHEKRAKATDLLHALLSKSFPDTPTVYQTKDQRPLAKYYTRLVPSCTSEVVKRVLKSSLAEELHPVSKGLLLRFHTDTLRNVIRDSLWARKKMPPGLRPLLTELPSSLEMEGPYTGFSGSMLFSFEILEAFVNEYSIGMQQRPGYLIFFQSLLKRAVQKRVDSSRIKEIVDMILCFLAERPKAIKMLDDKRNSVLYLTSLCWSRKPQMFENNLRALLRYVYKDNDTAKDSMQLDSVADLGRGMPKSKRYAFLHLCIQEVLERDIDVNDNLKGLGGTMRVSHFAQLDTGQALGLFSRLRTANGDHDLVDFSSVSSTSVLHLPERFGEKGGDVNLFHILLMYRHGDTEEAEILAKAEIEKRKKWAMSKSNQHERAFYAKSAVCYAAASGSVKLLKDVYTWAPSLPDHRAIMTLWSSHFEEEEVTLAGIPPKVFEVNSSALHDSIVEANEVLRLLFDTACRCIQEPSFQPSYWYPTYALIPTVVQVLSPRS